MNDKKSLSKEHKKILIEKQLFVLIEATLEGEYDTDRLNNLVYKDGGRKRALNRIKQLLNQWQKEYDFPREEMKDVLQSAIKSMDPIFEQEQKEIIGILSEIESEEKSNKNILSNDVQKDTEKDERDI